ncbi:MULTISPECIES: hypothetical protein [unclassified Oceanobacillus]|uniref:hypothetical protein n=1 Tax=unclassified Oceanobacillus TaxID=2630292 RepID=UPI0012EC9F40|nr:hypothetical protein [Oceanobacillus sp. AG]
MPNHEKQKITIDRTKETRSREIADMINEGGLGSEQYYVILKQQNDEEHQKIDNTDH